MMAEQRDATGDRGDRMTRRVLAVCDAAGAFIEWWGFKAIHGRVWTLLALRGQPMAQTEIASLLGVSRSLISGATHELVEWGLVRPTEMRRNAPYVAEIDVWPVIGDVLRSREWMIIEHARVALEAAVEEADLAVAGGEPIAWDVERMRMLLRMTETAQAFLRILVQLRVPTAVREVGGWITKATALLARFRRG